jgi:hydrogenase maturation factor HypF (carbamoyltransferase family)
MKNTTDKRFNFFIFSLALDLDLSCYMEDDQIFIVGKADERARFIERLMNNKPPMMSAFYSLSDANIQDDYAVIDVTILED